MLAWYTGRKATPLAVKVKRFLLWIVGNADTLVALVLAILVSLLDVTGNASLTVVTNATVVTLGVLAFILLHDRKKNDDTRAEIRKLELKIEERDSIRVLNGQDITRAVLQAQEDTEQWLFRGATATYVRTVVLPKCLEHAKKDRRGFRLRLEILDPRSEQACATYVKLNQDLAADDTGPEREWTVKGKQIELYATILAVCWHMNRSLDFIADVGLTTLVSSLRWEASSRWFIITQREPHFPAFLISRDDPLYGLFLADLNGSFRQAHQLPLKSVSKILVSDEPTVEEARAVLSQLEIGPPEDFTEDDISEIITKALHGTSPYA